MKVLYRDPGYRYSACSIAKFIKLEESKTVSIFHFLPELAVFKGRFEENMDNGVIVEEISDAVSRLYKVNETEIQDKVGLYQRCWNQHQDLINERFSAIFRMDTRALFNNLVCNITLNPISPRYLKELVFDVFLFE